MAAPANELGGDDVLVAFAASQEAIGAAVDGDWTALAGTLDWTCRRTLDHVIDGTVFYCVQVANEAPGRLPWIRRGDTADLSVEDLIVALVSVGHVFASVLRAAPASARAFHFAGMADMSGYAAMSCVEVLVHTSDIAQGLGIDFNPPAELCERVVRRLFPWIEDIGSDAWATLRWTTGRVSINGREDVAADWLWQCAPLSEWDGTVRKRQPPAGGR